MIVNLLSKPVEQHQSNKSKAPLRDKERLIRRRDAQGVATIERVIVPSIASTTQKPHVRRNFALGHLTRIRGLVQCMECHKTRGIYSLFAPANMEQSGDFKIEEQLDCR